MFTTYFKPIFITTILALVVSSITACGAPPKREPYQGQDQVGAFSADSLVGSWKVSVLNPIADENKNTVVYTFHTNGSFVSTVKLSEEEFSELGPMQFKGTGTWRIEGDQVYSQVKEITETTGNKYGKLMKAIMNSYVSKMSGTVNPYEISAARMVFVNSESGEATLLGRL